jgi:hypothetical protein
VHQSAASFHSAVELTDRYDETKRVFMAEVSKQLANSAGTLTRIKAKVAPFGSSYSSILESGAAERDSFASAGAQPERRPC